MHVSAKAAPLNPPVQRQLLGRCRQPFRTAQHMRDLHHVIVDDVGEIVRWPAVRLDDDRVTVDAHVHIEMPLNDVVEAIEAIGVHFEPAKYRKI